MNRVNRFSLMAALVALLDNKGTPKSTQVLGTPDPGGRWLKGKSPALRFGRWLRAAPVNQDRRDRRELEALLGERISGRQWKRIRKDRHKGAMRVKIDAALAGVEE